MIKKLAVRNYAIIEDIEADFSPGLNIITGETGAGKSILMGALSLILGDRADSSVLLKGEKKGIAEAVFNTDGRREVRNFLRQHDLDGEDELLIRREVSANGKSRAFVNDTPVNLEQLRQLSSLLVDLHRQFDTLELGESDFQIAVIDALAGHAAVLQQYETVFLQLQHSQRELDELLQQKASSAREQDYNQFLFDELEEANLQEDELEHKEAELKVLINAESIKAALDKASYALSEGDQPLVQQLKILLNQLQGFAGFHPRLQALLGRLQSAHIEMADIAGELAQVNEDIHYDAVRIAKLNDQLSTGYKLLKKHGVQKTADLLSLQHALSEKLQAVMNIDDAIESKKKVVTQLTEEAHDFANTLSRNRAAQAKPLQEKVNRLLAQVGMPNAALKVEIQKGEELRRRGYDDVRFLFDANKSGRFDPIRKVASGGELSRLMLCIKSLVARKLDLPTLIFDEIDTGISGEAARQVGVIMKELATQRQVISITHQPQIAGRADAHFFVYKEAKGQSVRANIRRLTQEERILTIAKMLSGERPTAAAMENAKEMVQQ